MKEKHFLQLQGVRSVDRVSNECLSAQAFDGFDFWLDEEFVQRVFSTHYDNHVRAIELHQGDRIVDGSVSDVCAPVRQGGAHGVRVRRRGNLHFDSEFRQRAIRFGGYHRQRTAWKARYSDSLRTRRLCRADITGPNSGESNQKAK